MGFNSPVPVNLAQECAKARKILNSFVDGANNGLDQVIPRSVLQHAKGFAIFTVAKAGFLLSARAGSGLVIARLPNGDWSAPSAIGTAGLGFGGQAGAEVTDFLIVLNSRSAVASFMAAGSLNLGGNMSLAVGPLGRNAEGMGAVNTKGKVAAMYSYSKTKGLFGGVSVEGSVIVERQDANRLAYGSTISSKQLLSGSIPIPAFADDLVGAILSATGLPSGREWVEDRPPSASGTGWESEPIAPLGSPGLDGGRAGYGFAGMGSGSGHGAAFSEGGGSKSGGGRSRSASLLSSVVGRNRSGSTASSTAAGGGGGGNAFGRNRGASVGSANFTSTSSPRLDSTGGKSGGGGSPRPGLFSSVSFTGRKRASSKSFAFGNPHDPPTLGGPEGDFHSSESYTSAGLSQRPGLAGSRRPSEYLDSKAGRRSPSDTADPNGLGLDGLEDDFARSARLTGDGGGSGNGRDRTFDDRFDQQRFDSSADEPPLGRYSIEDDDDLPRSSSRPQQSPFHDPSDRFAPPPLSSPPTKIKKPKPWQARPELGSRKGSSQRGSDFHTQPNMYYVETGGEPGPPPPMSSTAGGGSSSSNRRETDLFADPSPASNGGGESAVRAEEDWSVLGSRARAGLARTQSGNVLSAAHASGVGGLGPSTSASSSSGDTQSPPQARSAAPFGVRQQLGNQGDWSAAELRSAGYVGRGVALFDFAGVEVGDLSFHKGDVILLIEKTAEANDWWTGSVDGRGRTGSFPGTYIQLVN